MIQFDYCVENQQLAHLEASWIIGLGNLHKRSLANICHGDAAAEHMCGGH